MSDKFFQLVKRKSPIALVVTGYLLAVISNAPKPWVWFVADWPFRAIRAIAEMVDDAGQGALMT
ncbi:hypothetical protein HYALB_00012457 [Hymenoscyphus albidus]|uniref:Uncharacterized protein n=1 Tax=Hymenoscyphus albidus TaxID=595503 RepID=A0A9N9PYG1_9HELO|nr:hypothetical protein HYALB_00012457 [Hymenoscyphus albidus]